MLSNNIRRSVCNSFCNPAFFDHDDRYGSALCGAHGQNAGAVSYTHLDVYKRQDQGYVVLYLTAGQLFRKLEEIRFSKDEDAEKEEWDKELLEADLLIIDDLGTEFATLFTASELFRLINDRKLKNKSVIISTNLNPEDITNQYSDRITSRLREYKVLKFFGDDIRLVKKFRK